MSQPTLMFLWLLVGNCLFPCVSGNFCWYGKFSTGRLYQSFATATVAAVPVTYNTEAVAGHPATAYTWFGALPAPIPVPPPPIPQHIPPLGGAPYPYFGGPRRPNICPPDPFNIFRLGPFLPVLPLPGYNPPPAIAPDLGLGNPAAGPPIAPTLSNAIKFARYRRAAGLAAAAVPPAAAVVNSLLVDLGVVPAAEWDHFVEVWVINPLSALLQTFGRPSGAAGTGFLEQYRVKLVDILLQAAVAAGGSLRQTGPQTGLNRVLVEIPSAPLLGLNVQIQAAAAAAALQTPASRTLEGAADYTVRTSPDFPPSLFVGCVEVKHGLDAGKPLHRGYVEQNYAELIAGLAAQLPPDNPLGVGPFYAWGAVTNGVEWILTKCVGELVAAAGGVAARTNYRCSRLDDSGLADTGVSVTPTMDLTTALTAMFGAVGSIGTPPANLDGHTLGDVHPDLISLLSKLIYMFA